jgi:predicted transcriptional regulator
MKKIRRSFLQFKILVALKKKPAKTVVALSEIVNAQRPSISRSLGALKEQGLVSRDRLGWHITEKGEAELAPAKNKFEECQKDLKEAILKASKSILEVNSSNITSVAKCIGDIHKLISPITVFNSAYIDKFLPSITFIDSEYWGKISELIKIENPFLSNDFFQKTIKPILDIQEENSALMQKFMSSQTFFAMEAMTSLNNQLMAQTLDTLSGIRLDIFEKIGGGVLLNSFDWLANDISNVSQAFTHVFRDQIQDLDLSQLHVIDPKSTDKFLLPSTIVAAYTTSARNFIDADFTIEYPPVSLQKDSFDELGDQEIDSKLIQIDPVFVEMRQGAWQALHQHNPERLRHAATSQRELVRQLLVHLVPDVQLPQENKSGTQLKARIRIALRTSDGNAEFIDSLAKAVESIYDRLSKYTHYNDKHEESLIALMHTGEGLMRFILSLLTHDKNQDS